MSIATLFLDRDGVINSEIHNDYVKTWDQFIFEPHIFDALQLLQEKFERIIVVTNQRGVGAGLMTQEALDIIRNRADEIAAVMIEPIQSRRADFRPTEFIKSVRQNPKYKTVPILFFTGYLPELSKYQSELDNVMLFEKPLVTDKMKTHLKMCLGL